METNGRYWSWLTRKIRKIPMIVASRLFLACNLIFKSLSTPEGFLSAYFQVDFFGRDYSAIELQTSWRILCHNFYWNASKSNFGMCPFLQNFARLPHMNFIYLNAWRYTEASDVKKTELFDKSTKAHTSLISFKKNLLYTDKLRRI